MTRRITRDPIYRCRRFSAETIELCVRWFITYRLSYRNLAAMMAERDVIVSHTTATDRRRASKVRISQLGEVRYPQKISFGGNLYLLVTPKGGRYWRYCYRYGGKRRTLALGIYPDVPIARARSRHLAARQLLAAGVDPSLKREELRGTFRLRRC